LDYGKNPSPFRKDLSLVVFSIMEREDKVLVSGIKPTGRPHIGNYFGAIEQFVRLQDTYRSFVFIADLHALTTLQNPSELKEHTLDLVLDYLACGLDPKKVILYKQSDVPQVTELAWIFESLTTMPYLMRAHAYKDAEAKNKDINVAIFNYPLLMAADILIHNPDAVPVGLDQKQHLEITRDTADKFNRVFGETFLLPQPLISEDVQTIPGTDGQKMSKSYKNTVSLFATNEEIQKTVMSIPTDSRGVNDPKDPETDKVFAFHKLFTEGAEFDDLRDRYESGGVSYKESKEILINSMIRRLTPLREKRASLNHDDAKHILKEGGEIARSHGEKTMQEVREKVGLSL
jgi:tryptophanyl-tRNA synthetase